MSVLGAVAQAAVERGDAPTLEWPAQVVQEFRAAGVDVEAELGGGAWEIEMRDMGFMYRAIGPDGVHPAKLHGDEGASDESIAGSVDSKHAFFGADGY